MSILELRNIILIEEEMMKNIMLDNLKISEQRMLMTKQNRKLNLRKKCKFLKSAWKT
jgi:hypothetical protein